MKLEELIKRVDDAYAIANGGDEGVVEMYFEEEGDQPGDTLALFIVREIKATYDEKASDEDQLAEARRLLEVAAEELQGTAERLY